MVLFIAPLSVAVLIAYLNYFFKFFPMEDVEQPAAQVGAFLVTIPSFFCTVHVITAIYFTAPYCTWVKNLMGLSKVSVAEEVRFLNFRHPPLLVRRSNQLDYQLLTKRNNLLLQ